MKNTVGLFVVSCGCLTGASLVAQQKPPLAPPGPQSAVASQAATAPADYVIGPDDKLAVLFWKDEGMSGEFIVRPDGRISLPLLNDVHVAGLTPEQLRAHLLVAAKKYVEEPNVSVVVREIHSRKVFITGQVARPGPYQLTSPTTVLQLIAVAGGLAEFADGKNITIIRADNTVLKFNYNDVRKGKNLKQNVLLKIGDTVDVPE